MAIPETGPVTIDESGVNRILHYLAPGILLAIGASGIIRFGEAAPVPVSFVVFGVILLGISLVDAPTRVTFDATGVHRHCLLRSQTIEWDEVTAFERPARAPSPIRGLASAAGAGGRRAGGLVVRVGPKRRYLLLSRPERQDQWDKLNVRLKVWAPAVSMPGRPGN